MNKAINVAYLPEFVKWKVKQGFKKLNKWPLGAGGINMHFAYWPPQLNVKVLPQDVKKEITEKTKSTAFYISLVFGLVSAITLFLLAPFLASLFQVEDLINILRFCSLMFLLESVSIVSKGILQREMNFLSIVKINLTSFILGYALFGILLAYLDFSYWALIIGTIIQSAIRSFLYYKKASIPFFGKFSKSELKHLLNFGTGFTLARILNYFALQSDNFIISRYQGIEQLGIYGRAYQLMVLPASLIGGALDKVLFSAFSKTGQTKSKQYFIQGLDLSLLLSTIISSLFYFNNEIIVRIALGNQWGAVNEPFKILSIGLIFRLAYKINISIIRAEGKVYIHALTQFIYFLFVLVGCYYVRDLGFNEIAKVVTFAIILNYLTTLYFAKKFLNIFLKDVLKIHLKFIGIGILIWAIGYLLLNVMFSVIKINAYSQLIRLILNTLFVLPLILTNKLIQKKLFKRWEKK